jgi:hypothetical protein
MERELMKKNDVAIRIKVPKDQNCRSCRFLQVQTIENALGDIEELTCLLFGCDIYPDAIKQCKKARIKKPKKGKI